MDIAVENVPTLKSAIFQSKGLSLDELALMAYADGWITEATPHILLEAIESNRRRIDIEEANIIKQLEEMEWEEKRNEMSRM